MRLLYLSALIVHAVPLVSTLDAARYCGDACMIPLAAASFTGDTPESDYEAMVCQNLLRIQSLFLCMRDRCTQRQIAVGLKAMVKDCKQYGGYDALPWSVIDNITEADETTFTVIGFNDTVWGGSTTDPVVHENPVLLADDIFIPAAKTAKAWDESEVTRANYGYAMYGFWATVLLIGLLNRLFEYLSSLARFQQLFDSAGKQIPFVRSLNLIIRSQITTPALFGHRTAQPVGWCTIPPRLQSLTLLAFLVINVVLCCVSYNAFDGNLYWAKKETQIWRYMADRTGCIAMANMPLIWAFAMRNNVLIWLTGWSFATFNQFHRWVARIATVQAVLHSVGYTVEAFQDGGKAAYIADFSERYWWMGVIATIVMSILCGTSIYPLRRMLYEIFLLAHILMAVLFLIGMYYHVEIFEGEYNPYIWPCVAVWTFDRFLRITRVVSLSLGASVGTVTYSAESDLVRLDVPVRSTIRPRPGTHYYLYVLNGLRIWESHPFTISSWTNSTDRQNGAASKRVISFAVRPYNGFTGRLRNLALRPGDTEHNTSTITAAPLRIVVEGPYGSSHDLRNFNYVQFIVGGSGITVALAYARALFDDMNNSPSPKPHKVHLVWAVKDRAICEDVFEREIKQFWLGENGLASKIEVQIDLYVTRSRRSALSGSETNLNVFAKEVQVEVSKTQSMTKVSDGLSSKSVSDFDNAPGVTISSDRPDVSQIITSSSLVHAIAGGRMAVVCCGPASMADDGRSGVVAALAQGCNGLEYFPESFSW